MDDESSSGRGGDGLSWCWLVVVWRSMAAWHSMVFWSFSLSMAGFESMISHGECENGVVSIGMLQTEHSQQGRMP